MSLFRIAARPATVVLSGAMKGQHEGFGWRIEGRWLIVSSLDPQLGELKRYDLGGGGAPQNEQEARSLAHGRIELDRSELEQLEQAKEG